MLQKTEFDAIRMCINPIKCEYIQPKGLHPPIPVRFSPCCCMVEIITGCLDTLSQGGSVFKPNLYVFEWYNQFLDGLGTLYWVVSVYKPDSDVFEWYN